MVGKDVVNQLVSRIEKSYETPNRTTIEKEVEALLMKYEQTLLFLDEETLREVTPAIIRTVTEKLGLKRKEPVDAKIADLEEGMFVNVEAKVLGVASPKSENGPYVPIVADETGKIPLVIFPSAIDAGVKVPKKGQCYRITNLKVEQRMGRLRLVASSKTEFTPIDKEIDVKVSDVEAVALITKIHSNSGLIFRCANCNRTKKSKTDKCPNCGSTETKEDLRAKVTAIVNGVPRTLVIGRELVEQLTGITLEEAKKMAAEAMDRTVVVKALEQHLLCRYFYTKFADFTDNAPVHEMRPAKPEDIELAEVAIEPPTEEINMTAEAASASEPAPEEPGDVEAVEDSDEFEFEEEEWDLKDILGH